MDYYSIRWLDGVVSMIDQRLLPDEVVYHNYTDYKEIAEAIRNMTIRGAPAIGVAAGYGLALVAYHQKALDTRHLAEELNKAAILLKQSRPTAFNLFAAIERIEALVTSSGELPIELLKQSIIRESQKIAEEEIQMNLRIARYGQQFIPEEANIIHHCNTGALATVGIGTALGVIRVAHEMGKKVHVFVDETRPRLQGSRLTAWELMQLGIPHTVIVDGASGYIMKTNKIDACLVGCDRIAANGDVANKIGTYNLAIVASAHRVPFYSVGPTTTVDLSTRRGDSIAIEDRSTDEVTKVGSTRVTPEGVHVVNPAFDVTPAKYITAIITDMGIVRPPYEKSLEMLIKG